MKELRFRVWHTKENKMYYRGYQKFLHALLCEDDGGSNEGRGRPVKRASYTHCVFLESAGIEDKNRREIFEGDIVRIRHAGRCIEDVVGPVPDMFGSKKIHPLHETLKKNDITGDPARLDMEVIGNEYENPELLKKTCD